MQWRLPKYVDFAESVGFFKQSPNKCFSVMCKTEIAWYYQSSKSAVHRDLRTKHSGIQNTAAYLLQYI